MAGIHKAMVAIQDEIKEIAKDQLKGVRFDARTIDTLLNTVGPIFRKNKVFLRPSVKDITRENVTYSSGSTGFVTVVQMEYTFTHEDGSEVAVSAAGEASDTQGHATSQAQTDAYKVAIFQTFSIPLVNDGVGDKKPTMGTAPLVARALEAIPKKTTPAEVMKVAEHARACYDEGKFSGANLKAVISKCIAHCETVKAGAEDVQRLLDLQKLKE